MRMTAVESSKPYPCSGQTPSGQIFIEVDGTIGGLDQQIDFGMPGFEVWQPGQQPLQQKRMQGANAQHAFGCHLDATAIATKQWQTQVLLERLYLHAGGADTDAQRLGRPGKTEVLGHSHKNPQASEWKPAETGVPVLRGATLGASRAVAHELKING